MLAAIAVGLMLIAASSVVGSTNNTEDREVAEWLFLIGLLCLGGAALAGLFL